MKDRCTPATARRLKERGFPQPVPAPGQVWIGQKYGTDIAQYGVIIGDKIVFESGEFNNLGVVERGRYLYAPTAPDILRELMFTWNLFYTAIDDMYNCVQDQSTDLFSNENPAEACAEAWEAKQKQP